MLKDIFSEHTIPFTVDLLFNMKKIPKKFKDNGGGISMMYHFGTGVTLCVCT